MADEPKQPMVIDLMEALRDALAPRYGAQNSTEEQKITCPEQEFLNNPGAAFRPGERVHIVNDEGNTAAIVSVPNDPWPEYMNDEYSEKDLQKASLITYYEMINHLKDLENEYERSGGEWKDSYAVVIRAAIQSLQTKAFPKFNKILEKIKNKKDL